MNLKEIRDEAYDIAREVGATDADRFWKIKEMNRYINRVYRFIACLLYTSDAADE